MTDNPWAPLDAADPWGTPCACEHPMRRHTLDWDLDPEVDCDVEGCDCPEFLPTRPGVDAVQGFSYDRHTS